MENLGKVLGMIAVIALSKVAIIMATQELETLTNEKPSTIDD